MSGSGRASLPVLLLLLAARCGGAGEAPGGATGAGEPASVEADLKRALAGELGTGWTTAFFAPDTLYNEIDGEAAEFLAFRFQGMFKAVVDPALARAARAAPWVEPDRPGRDLLNAGPALPALADRIRVYDMGHPVSAFGIYSTMRTPENEFGDAGAEAFWNDAEWTGFAGRFFFEVKAPEGLEAEDAKRRSLEGARRIVKALGAPAGLPEALTLADVEGKVARSEEFSNDGALGKGFLGRTLRFRWKLGEAEGQAFVSILGSRAEASTAHGRLLEANDPSDETAIDGERWRFQFSGPCVAGAEGPDPGRDRVLAAILRKVADLSDGDRLKLDLPPPPAARP